MVLKELDIETFESFANGSREAFGKIYQVFVNPLYFYTYKMLGDRPEAEDVTANCFINLWQARESIMNPHNLRLHLYLTAYYAIIDILCANKCKKSLQRKLSSPITSSESTLDLEMLHSGMISEIYREVDKLPDRAKEVLYLMNVKGKSAQKVAAIMEIDLKTVYSQCQYAQKLLRMAVKDKELEAAFTFLILL